MTQEMQYNTNSSRRRHANTIERPMTYEPTNTNFYKPSVEPAVMPKKAAHEKFVGFWTFLIIGAIAGLISGLILSGTDNVRNTLYWLSDGYPSAGITAFCIVWGLLLGAVFGLILNLLYKVVKKSLPLYALLLFIPTVLVLLASPLLVITNLVIELLKVVLTIAVVVIIIIIGIAWLGG